MHARRLFQNVSLYLVCNLASRAVGFLMIPIYSRCLTPAEYGAIELIELSIEITALLIGLQSIGGAMIRIYHEKDDPAWRAGVTATALIAAALGNGIAMGAGALAGDPLARLLFGGADSALLVRTGFCAAFFANLAEVGLVYLRLRDRVAHFVIYSLVQLAAAVSLNIYFIAYLRLGVWGFMLSKLIVCSAGALLLAGITLRESGFRLNFDAARRMARFGAPLVVSSASFFVIHFSDRFLLKSFGSLADVGNYALAYRFALVVSLLVGEAFGRAWNVSLYSITARADWEYQFARVLRYLTFALLLTGLCVTVFGESAIRIMTTPAYYDAATVLPILVFAYVTREVGDFFRNVLYIRKLSGAVGRIALISAGIKIGLSLALIPYFGMRGAAWATFLTWSAYVAMCWHRAGREHNIPFPARTFIMALSVCAAIAGVARALPDLPLALHLAVRTAMVLQFVALMWALDYFPAQERSFIRGKVALVFAGLGGRAREGA